jgi:hypothetical protein
MRGLTAAAALCCALPAGCVDRRFIITTPPEQALASVEVNDRPIGPAPADKQFTYYGTYRIVLKKEGYETLVVDQPIAPPWYEYPPLDFISENLIPWTIRDVRRLYLPMRPAQIVAPEAVLDRATHLREQGKAIGQPVPGQPAPGQPVPVPTVGPVPPGPPPAQPIPTTVPAVPAVPPMPPPQGS